MLNQKLSIVVTALLFVGISTESCHAGPLLDWLRGRPSYPYQAYRPLQNGIFNRGVLNNNFRQRAYYPGSALGMAPMAQAPAAQPAASLAPGTCSTTCPTVRYQTVNRVVANYVPYTAFRTEWHRVPTTYYRPVTTTNPQTGCVTRCMKPCTTYQMQARRVPYTTYQTVYRTVQHRVPYTTYETSYSTNGSCSSCGTNAYASMVPGQPMAGQPVIQGPASYGLNTGANYSVPANQVPQLSPGEIQPDASMQRPSMDPPAPQPDANTSSEPDTTNSSHSRPNVPQINAPAPRSPGIQAPVVDDSNRTASLIRGKWNYSPVRHAGYSVATRANVSPSTPASHSTGHSSPSSSKSNEPFRSVSRNTGWSSIKP